LDQCVTPLLGKRTVKIDPLPGSLVTVTSPPIMRASLRVNAVDCANAERKRPGWCDYNLSPGGATLQR
jgi:hypothetical protein